MEILRQLARLLGAFIRYFLWPLVTGRKVEWPAQLRKVLEKLGGTWIKLGQALALRFDLLPAAYCYELFKLMNEVAPFSEREVRNVILAELGQQPDQLFRRFEMVPFAAASIGQVHRAQLNSGQEVAVKVQRPGVREIIRRDIRVMYTLAGLLDSINAFGSTRMRGIIEEFERWTKAELDYLVEARNAVTIAANAADDPNEVNPKIYLKYTTKRVLTMEFIDGIPIIDVIYALRDGKVEFMRGLADRGLSLSLLARALCWNSLNQIYQFGHFHADLHPANLLALPGNAIGYVDFGIVGRMSSELRVSLALFANSLFYGELSGAVDELTLWIRPSSSTDSRIARSDLERIMEEYLIQVEDPKLASRCFSTLEFGVLNVIRKHRMALDSNVALYFKAVTALDTVIYQLFPEFDLRPLELEFFQRFKRLELSRLLRLEELEDNAASFQLRFGRALRGLERLAFNRELASDGRGGAWDGPRRGTDYVNFLLFTLFSVAVGLYLGRSDGIARLRSSLHGHALPGTVGFSRSPTLC